MLNARKLDTDDLEKISGGTYEDAEPYLQELYAKYGMNEDQLEDLLKVITNEEFSNLWDLVHKR